MAQILEVRCRQCGTTSSQLDGPIMAGYLPRCVQCGQDTLVRWQDVPAEDPVGLDSASAETPDSRIGRIQELAGPCACGGTFSMDAHVRCSDCRSLDVETTHVGSAD